MEKSYTGLINVRINFGYVGIWLKSHLLQIMYSKASEYHHFLTMCNIWNHVIKNII